MILPPLVFPAETQVTESKLGIENSQSLSVIKTLGIQSLGFGHQGFSHGHIDCSIHIERAYTALSLLHYDK